MTDTWVHSSDRGGSGRRESEQPGVELKKKQRITSHWDDLGRILREVFLNIIHFFIVFSILIIFFPHSYIAVLLAVYLGVGESLGLQGDPTSSS